MKIGVVGTGTVGEGVLKLLSLEGKRLEKLFGKEVEVVRICDMTERSFNFGSYEFTNNYLDIVENEEVDTVVELIGGVGAAYDIAKRALKLGKNLVTANKHLVAVHGRELFDLAEKNKVKLYFEAAIGGGIPVVAPMTDTLFINEFNQIRGILNGTCNYMLSKMEEGMTYEEALVDAKTKGYAEADPTFDVEGIDTAHKISVLAYLAWGELIDFDGISIEGIHKLTSEDIKKAKDRGQRYKLLGEACREDNKLKVKVSPQLVGKDELLYEVGGVYNAVEIDASYTGKTILYGEGAGMDATATAVISDIYRILKEKTFQNSNEIDEKLVAISKKVKTS